jgi:hypothetical protein
MNRPLAVATATLAAITLNACDSMSGPSLLQATLLGTSVQNRETAISIKVFTCEQVTGTPTCLGSGNTQAHDFQTFSNEMAKQGYQFVQMVAPIPPGSPDEEGLVVYQKD